MKTAHVFILLGGMFGGGPSVAVNEGMDALAFQLGRIPGVKVTSYPWAEYERIAVDHVQDGTSELVVIGYSGGGWKATVLANEHPGILINLMGAAYDPSPAWSMQSVIPARMSCGRSAITTPRRCSAILAAVYCAASILGRSPSRRSISRRNICSVQNDQRLHEQTIAAVKALIG